MLDASNRNWQQGLLHALAQSKNFDTALAFVEQLLQSRPDDADLWLYRAHIANLLRDKETALASLETAIRLGKNSPSYLQACANLHMQLGSTDRAIALIKTGIVRDMNFEFVDQAIFWLIENESWQGAESLTKDLKARWENLSDTDKSALLVKESRILQNKKDEANAARLLQQALELDGGNVPALMALAGLQLKNKNYPRAEILYQRASAYPSHRENALIALAQIAIDTQDYQKALELLQEVIRINPDQIEIKRNIQSLESLVLLKS
jgi:tetratricopeptide (TPR) repeat protein